MAAAKMKVSGTYRDGRLYVGNGRWARVLETRRFEQPTLITVSYGVEGASRPTSSEACGDRKTADSCARAHIEGEEA